MICGEELLHGRNHTRVNPGMQAVLIGHNTINKAISFRRIPFSGVTLSDLPHGLVWSCVHMHTSTIGAL